MYIFLRLLLSIAHFLYNLYYFIEQWCLRLIMHIKQFKYLNNNSNKCLYINTNNHSFELSKIPRHLAVLIGQENITNFDFIKLTSWCMAAEIPYISFYDHKGFLQNSQNSIKKDIKKLEYFSTKNIDNLSNNIDGKIKNITNFKINETDSSICRYNYDKQTDIFNGYKTKIQVLSYSDGKDKIIVLTKNLAKLIDSDVLQIKDITSDLLDEKLNLNRDIPDPDLAIVCGKTMCNYGFLPWHTKITEFFTIPSLHDISLKNFIKTLTKFSECQQRYGR